MLFEISSSSKKFRKLLQNFQPFSRYKAWNTSWWNVAFWQRGTLMGQTRLSWSYQINWVSFKSQPTAGKRFPYTPKSGKTYQIPPQIVRPYDSPHHSRSTESCSTINLSIDNEFTYPIYSKVREKPSPNSLAFQKTDRSHVNLMWTTISMII